MFRTMTFAGLAGLLLALGGAVGGVVWPAPLRAESLSSYGTPGLIDMPSATVTRDGTLHWTTSALGGHTRNALQFQITPRLSGVFRYSILQDYLSTGNDLFDRSFDLHYLLRPESQNLPALAVGLRDFGGTGIFGGEYLVVSKHFLNNRLALSGGIGWGRLASHGGFRNPLAFLGDSLETRPGFSGIEETGRVAADRFFRGDAALFGGLSYQLNDRLRLAIEYSSDAYTQEVSRMGFHHRSPLNFGLSYRLSQTLSLNGFVIGGDRAGLGFTYQIDPRRPRMPGGSERDTPALRPRAEIAALGWMLTDLEANRARLSAALADQGLDLQSFAQNGTTAQIVLHNPRYRTGAQALGRAARVMANTLPAEIETFEITLVAGGMPTSRTTLRRADLHALEHAWDGSWQSFVRADIADAPTRLPPDPGAHPRLDWSLLPYFRSALFDPDAPLRMDFGLAANMSYRLASTAPEVGFSSR